MPVYCFMRRKGKETLRIEKSMKADDLAACRTPRNTYRIDGKEWERDYRSEMVGTPEPACWPMTSDAMGVLPHEIGEAYRRCAEAGVPTDFTKDGRAIIRDRHHRRRLAKMLGHVDLDAGYSDPQ